MKKFKADRIEEGFLVCVGEGGKTVNVPLSSPPAGASEGWTVTLSDDGEILSAIEGDASSLSKKRNRFAKLFKKST